MKTIFVSDDSRLLLRISEQMGVTRRALPLKICQTCFLNPKLEWKFDYKV